MPIFLLTQLSLGLKNMAVKENLALLQPQEQSFNLNPQPILQPPLNTLNSRITAPTMGDNGQFEGLSPRPLFSPQIRQPSITDGIIVRRDLERALSELFNVPTPEELRFRLPGFGEKTPQDIEIEEITKGPLINPPSKVGFKLPGFGEKTEEDIALEEATKGPLVNPPNRIDFKLPGFGEKTEQDLLIDKISKQPYLSTIEEVLGKPNLPEKWTKDQLMGYFKGKLSKEEYARLPEMGDRVNKSELLAGLKGGGFAPELSQVEEVVKGIKPSPNEPRDIIAPDGHVIQDVLPHGTEGFNDTKFSQYQLPGGENYREIGILAKDMPKGQEFISSHFPDWKNPIAHLRVNDRTYKSPNDVYFIEELQSDWAKAQRGGGKLDLLEATNQPANSDGSSQWFVVERGNENDPGILFNTKQEAQNYLSKHQSPTHPLLKNWQELALKRVVKEAVEKGYDYISWTTGEQQAERYDLSKQLDKVFVLKKDNGEYFVRGIKGGNSMVEKHIPQSELPNVVGKDLAGKIINDFETPQVSEYGKNSKLYSGLDLKVGGEWAKNLYDRQVPNILKDLTKGGVENVNIGQKGHYTVINTLTKQPVIPDADYTEGQALKQAEKYRQMNKKEWQGQKQDFTVVEKGSTQPALKITPEIKNKVLGVKPTAKGGEIAYHQTSKKNAEAILKEGFKMPKEGSEFTTGPAISLSRELPKKGTWGTHTLKIDVSKLKVIDADKAEDFITDYSDKFEKKHPKLVDKDFERADAQMRREAAQELVKQGYDAIEIKPNKLALHAVPELQIINPSILKTLKIEKAD